MTPRQHWIAIAICIGIIMLLAATSILLNRSAEDASIGGGLVLLVLLMMALPWSVPVYLSEVGDTSLAFLAATLAIMNLGLIVAIARKVAARRG